MSAADQEHPPPSCARHHCIAVRDGLAYAYATTSDRGNRFGQLGRGTASSKKDVAATMEQPMVLPPGVGKARVVAAAAGGDGDGGHSALVLSDGSVLTCGCDRWQQLGLGSSLAGSAGYTWKDGKIWQSRLQRLDIQPKGADDKFIDVQCGADYTILRSRKGDVVGFGRSHLGQVSGNGKRGPFVAAPVNAVRAGNERGISAVKTKPDGDCTLLFREWAKLRRAFGEGNGQLSMSGSGDDELWRRLTAASGERNGALEMNGRCSRTFVMAVLSGMMATK